MECAHENSADLYAGAQNDCSMTGHGKSPSHCRSKLALESHHQAPRGPNKLVGRLERCRQWKRRELLSNTIPTSLRWRRFIASAPIWAQSTCPVASARGTIEPTQGTRSFDEVTADHLGVELRLLQDDPADSNWAVGQIRRHGPYTARVSSSSH
jgi:hypothetical protein